MRQADAKSLFNTWVWDSDFSHPLDMMQFATAAATRSGSKNRFVAIFDKRAKDPGWRKPDHVSNDMAEVYDEYAKGGLLRMTQGAGNLIQFSFTTVTGTLAAPAGLPGAVVEAGATTADIVAGNVDPERGVIIVAATAAGLYLQRGRDLRLLGLDDTARRLSEQAGRPVNFMIFETAPDAIGRSPSIVVPR